MKSSAGMDHAKTPWKLAETSLKKETPFVQPTLLLDAQMAHAESLKLTAQLSTTAH
jgi:hypothetical protein